MADVPDVLLATCADFPDGEPDGHLLVEELARRGVEARWAAWDDPEVDWSAARLVLVRSTWDYDSRRDEFLAWARSVGERLVHQADVLAFEAEQMRWNVLEALRHEGEVPFRPNASGGGREGVGLVPELPGEERREGYEEGQHEEPGEGFPEDEVRIERDVRVFAVAVPGGLAHAMELDQREVEEEQDRRGER